MKNLLLLTVMLLATALQLRAQDGRPTDKGSWLIEANTNFGRGHAANTGFYWASVDDTTIWNVGAEGGYFVMDDLAVKVGLGYGDSNRSEGVFSFKAGAKYYVKSTFPVQVDLNGLNTDVFGGFSPLFLGVQGGYAWFLGEHVALEPGIRYDFGLNDDASGQNGLTSDQSGLSLNIGFSLYF